MKTPENPENEVARLQALHNLRILDTEPEERFDRLTRMAKRMFHVPIALVSLVDENRQWFKSCFGLSARETPRNVSFCGHAILNSKTFVIPNTLKDERFADNPLVTGEPKIRFYAGTPIKTAEGHLIGTLCIIDEVARDFVKEDIEMLEDLARMVEKEIGAVQLATMDDLTGISNRRGFYMIAEHSLSLCLRHKSPATIAVFDLNNFKHINDTYGHSEGDRVIKIFADNLKQFFRESDLVARFGGDEFAALMLNTQSPYADQVLGKLNASLTEINQRADQKYEISCSVGLATFDASQPKTIQALVEEADLRMYEQKRGFHDS
jgi:diguanylate cyclase (GGDEF)-like protein